MPNLQKYYPTTEPETLIIDHCRIGTNIKVFHVGSKGVNKFSEKFHFKKKNKGYERIYTSPRGEKITVFLHMVYKTTGESFAQLSFSRDFNGNELYRKINNLSEPKFLSTDGKSNFVSVEEAKRVVAEGGPSRRHFNLHNFPRIVTEELKLTHRELCRWLSSGFKSVHPEACIDGKIQPHCTFSFQSIEIANDVGVPKWFISYDAGGRRVEFDPTVDPGVLGRLSLMAKEQHSLDWLTPESHVAASELSYRRGCRQVQYRLHEKGVWGHTYLKFIHGDELDLLRNELKFDRDTVVKVGGRKAFASADEMRTIIRKLFTFNHNVTRSLFNVTSKKLTDKERDERLATILAPHVTRSEWEDLLINMNPISLKFHIKNLNSGTQAKVRNLVTEGMIFRQAPKTLGGYYFIDSKLLGNLDSTVKT